jgi:cytochrome c6
MEERMKAMISTMALGILLATAVPAAAADAGALYKSKCQVCHGADGKGTPAGQKLGVKDFQSPEVAKQSDADLMKTTKEGKGKMPKYDGKLTDDQIEELIKHIRSLK